MRYILITSLVIAFVAAPRAALKIDVLRSIGGLPAHIVGGFEEAIGFQQAADGDYFVFDRRAHAVFTVDANRTAARKVVEIGQEDGRIIQPNGFDISPEGRFVVADAPRGQQRVQSFEPSGLRLGGFFLPGQPAARIIFGGLMLNGASSIQLTGTTLLISHPETGSLFAEYTLAGYGKRSIGTLRNTSFEDDRDLHVAMNAGLPLTDPTGGYYYVFITGRPIFRKYDARGELVYERHIEGAEMDDLLAAQPTRWPRRRVQDHEVPFVTPVIRAAAVSARGELWVSLAVPYTYVYDPQGDKIRTVQFSATGVISPSSLSFARNGRLLVTPGCFEFDPAR